MSGHPTITFPFNRLNGSIDSENTKLCSLRRKPGHQTKKRRHILEMSCAMTFISITCIQLKNVSKSMRSLALREQYLFYDVSAFLRITTVYEKNRTFKISIVNCGITCKL